MKYRSTFIICHFLILWIFVAGQSFSQKQKQLVTAANRLQSTLININDISMWIRNDGWSGRNPETGEAGIIYPRGAAEVVFQDGILWGGLVKDDRTPELRLAGQTYNVGTIPGVITAEGMGEYFVTDDIPVWRIRGDWQTADLTADAAQFFNISPDSVTRQHLDSLRTRYANDWNAWPWEKGAPFYDRNGNGKMDADEQPGLANADQVVWLAVNDITDGIDLAFYGSPPAGIEMQVTLWAYKERKIHGEKVFGSTIFKRYRLIYKGLQGTHSTPEDARIDRMFIAQWADPDIGHEFDDFVGCDTTLQTAFAYNATPVDREFGTSELPPPSVGYVLLQGPIVKSDAPNSVATFDFNEKQGFVNLPMFAFTGFGHGIPVPDPQLGSYRGAIQWYNIYRGFYTNDVGAQPFTDHEGHPTRFPLSGDPLTHTGDLDGLMAPPGDRRFMFSTGPFTMALGDTQEVIIALVGGLGADNRYSVQVMKHHAKWARQLYRDNFELPPEPEPEEPPLPSHFRLSQNFPNPFNPSTEIRFELPVERHITLKIYNTLGQKVKTLVDEIRDVGSYSVIWDGTDERGQPVPSGIYFYRFDAGAVSGTKKMILMR